MMNRAVAITPRSRAGGLGGGVRGEGSWVRGGGGVRRVSQRTANSQGTSGQAGEEDTASGTGHDIPVHGEQSVGDGRGRNSVPNLRVLSYMVWCNAGSSSSRVWHCQALPRMLTSASATCDTRR